MSDKKIILQFIALTFCIAYGVSGVLIILGQFGYSKIAGKGYVFIYILFHTMFNATSSLLGNTMRTWTGTIVANTVIIIFSLVIVIVYRKSKNR